MTTIKLFDKDGTLIAKAFENQEKPLIFYVLAGKMDKYRELQKDDLAGCPVEELSHLPGEPYPDPPLPLAEEE